MSKKEDNSRILTFSCLHVPYMHRDAVAFLEAIKNKFKPTRVIDLGDTVDFHSMSFHNHSPDLPGPSDELKKAIDTLKPIYKLFPNVDAMDSNHSSLIYRRAVAYGIPSSVIRPFNEIMEAPSGWQWMFDLTITLPTGGRCYFHHSRGANVMRVSQGMGMSVVSGHLHSEFSVGYWGNPSSLNFGMQVGCLVNPKALAFAYGNNNMKRQMIGCGVIVDGKPQLIPMVLDKHGRWNGKL